MEKILNDFGVQPILLLAQIVNFLVLLFILQKLLYKPILKVLEERKRKIEESLTNAEKIQKELEETEVKSTQIIEKAVEEGKKIVAEAQLQSNVLRQESQEQTKKEMEDLMAQGMQMIAGEKEKMKSEVKSEVATMIQMSMEKVLGKALDSKMQQKLVEESVKTIKA
jgi:F-type H+-transporting ATPase subunit b